MAMSADSCASQRDELRLARSAKMWSRGIRAIAVMTLIAALEVQTGYAQNETGGAKPVANADKASVAKAKTGRVPVNFTQLSFTPETDGIDPKTGQPEYQKFAPQSVKDLNGKEVRIRGYMMPIRMDGNEVREFLIVPNQSACCYGTTPRFWEFIVAVKTGDAVPNLMDTPLTFEGVLKVGDVYEQGYWTQLYTLECTRVIK
ncbi:MAG: DUF3299 domain-containing protein [Rariglobus sp.]